MIQMDASKTLKTFSTKWIPQLSIMRIAACIAIVALHTVFAANEYFAEDITATQNIVSRIIENNMMWAVPVFLMVTGVLHLGNRGTLSIKKLYKKYILRIIVVLTLFSLAFRLFDMIMDGETISVYGLGKGLYEMITSSGWGHLWYLYLLIGLYVLMPFYKKISETCSDSELVYLMIVYIVFLSLIPVIEAYGINIGVYISESLIYPLYLFLGHMIHEKRIDLSKETGIALVLISSLLIIIITVLKYRAGIEMPSELLGYQSPLVIIQSTGVFVIFDKYEVDTSAVRKNRVLITLDKLTFGIYLVHMAFVRLLFRYMQFNPYKTLAPVTLVICIICIFGISCLLTALLKKIPGAGAYL